MIEVGPAIVSPLLAWLPAWSVIVVLLVGECTVATFSLLKLGLVLMAHILYHLLLVLNARVDVFK